MLRKLLPLIDMLVCAVLLVLLLLDAFFPLWNLFLSDFVKRFILITGLLSALCGILLAGGQRRQTRSYRRMR